MIKIPYKTLVGVSVLCLITACSKPEAEKQKTVDQSISYTEPAVLTVMPGSSYPSSSPEPSEDEIKISNNLLDIVKTLSVDIGERNIEKPTNYKKASSYIKKKLTSNGYEVKSSSYFYNSQTVENIYSIKSANVNTDKVVIVGAHYDSLSGTVGANDNGSGVAVLLELARILRNKKLNTNIHFVAFANEEPPYFKTENMGSLVYAKSLRKQGINIVAMYSLETMGAYYDTKGSQRYPFPLGQYYPDTANFIAFVSDTKSRKLLKNSVKIFRDSAKIPSEGLSAPEDLEGVSWSDHWSFWQAGYPAIMITDTAPFRYKHYHQVTDTYDKIDFIRMSRVTSGISQMLQQITK